MSNLNSKLIPLSNTLRIEIGKQLKNNKDNFDSKKNDNLITNLLKLIGPKIEKTELNNYVYIKQKDLEEIINFLNSEELFKIWKSDEDLIDKFKEHEEERKNLIKKLLKLNRFDHSQDENNEFSSFDDKKIFKNLDNNLETDDVLIINESVSSSDEVMIIENEIDIINNNSDDIINNNLNNMANHLNKDQNESTINTDCSINKLNDADNIYQIIFDYISIEDLLNCRLVNKQFKNQFEKKFNKLTKLIVGEEDDDYWYFNLKPIDKKDVISLEFYRAIKSKSIFNLERNLKCLKFNYITDRKFKLGKEISNLINLECLEINLNLSAKKFEINLNNLKILIIYYTENFDHNRTKLILQTPSLERIDGPLKSIEFKSDKKSIKKLTTKSYINELKDFKNLQEIILLYSDGNIDSDLLSIFKELKILEINTNMNFGYFYDKIKSNLIKILDKRTELNREIEIYLEAVKITNVNQFKEVENYQYKNREEFQFKNFKLLNIELMDSVLNFNYLERWSNCNLKQKLPLKFFHGYQITDIVVTEQIENIDDFFWFIDKLTNLDSLSIHIPLEQTIYDKLPDKISDLHICISDIANSKFKINYDFILKLTKLKKLFIDGNHSIFFGEDKIDLFEFPFKLFSTLEKFHLINFYHQDRNVEITKCDPYYYDLKYEQSYKPRLTEIKLKKLLKNIKLKGSLNLKRKRED